jgi:hypothetical protein
LFKRADHIAVRLHNTDVVRIYPDNSHALFTGGWRTVTTKDRINKYSRAHLFTVRGAWYVSRDGHWNADTAALFADGITLHADGRIEGDAPRSAADTEKKHRKATRAYARAFVDALFAGKVDTPSVGDCWGCCMRAQDGSHPMGGADHILQHLEENYFVPSLLVNALEAFGASIAMKQTAHALMQHKPEYSYARTRDDFTLKQIEKSIYRWCNRQLGMSA